MRLYEVKQARVKLPKDRYDWEADLRDQRYKERVAKGSTIPSDEELVKIANQVIKNNLQCTNSDLYGWCAPLTIALWDALGQPKDYVPYSVMWAGEEHVLLYSPKYERAIDITGMQFDEPFINNEPKESYDQFYRLPKKELALLKDG